MVAFRQLLGYGIGMQPSADLYALRGQLTRAERRRVGRLVRRGEAAWDVPSARLAVGTAKIVTRQPNLFGPRVTTVIMGLLAIGFWVSAIDRAAGDDPVSLKTAYYLLFACVFSWFVVRYPALVRNAPRALERNEAILAGHDVVPLPPVQLTPAERWLSMVLAAALYGGLFALLGVWLDSGDESLAGHIFGGVLFGIFMVAVPRLVLRRRARRAGPSVAG